MGKSKLRYAEEGYELPKTADILVDDINFVITSKSMKSTRSSFWEPEKAFYFLNDSHYIDEETCGTRL